MRDKFKKVAVFCGGGLNFSKEKVTVNLYNSVEK